MPLSKTDKSDLLKIRAIMLSPQNRVKLGVSALRLHCSNVKYYTQVSNNFSNSLKLTPDFITGFSDAEGSFMISITSNKAWRQGWSVATRFEITLHLKDEELLVKICEFFKGVGSIYRFGEDKITYRVNRLDELLTIIIPHFKLYPLKTNKQKDFELFLKGVEYINKKEHLTEEGFSKLVAIRASLNLGLSNSLKAAFPLCVPAPRSELVLQPLNPQWVAGFTSGEGYFGVKLSLSRTIKTGVQVSPVFQITQHRRDELLMKSLVDYFGCGKYYSSNRAEYGDYIVTKLSYITDKIIPFFVRTSYAENQIAGVKYQNFKDWCKVVSLMKDKQHLTPSGLDKIKEIISDMNKNRSF